jgi:hypothetical protein
MELEDYIEKKQEKPVFYVRVSVCYYHDDNGLHMRKDIRYLKRKSPKGSLTFIQMDASEGGADCAYKNFKDLDEGIYKVTVHTTTDWETGYVDDWNYQIEKET